MKKLFVIIAILVSYLAGAGYSEGFKLYKQAQKALKKSDLKTANQKFLEAKIIFLDVAKNSHSSSALLKLSELYCNGWGVVKDETQAKTYLIKAKKAGASLKFVNDKCIKNLN